MLAFGTNIIAFERFMYRNCIHQRQFATALQKLLQFHQISAFSPIGAALYILDLYQRLHAAAAALVHARCPGK